VRPKGAARRQPSGGFAQQHIACANGFGKEIPMIADVKKSAEQKMQKSVEALKADLGKVRTGRAHTGLLDHIKIDYYGTMMPINQVANVTLADAHTITVQPWEKKMVQVVEKAIRDSDLGLNPATSGDVIRVPMPALTEERRKELTKVVHREAENARVAIRNIRRDAISHLKDLLKSKSVAEDEERRAQDDVQKLTDRYIAEVDKLLHAKEVDLMAV
jgi:ribosome recycling factor